MFDPYGNKIDFESFQVIMKSAKDSFDADNLNMLNLLDSCIIDSSWVPVA